MLRKDVTPSRKKLQHCSLMWQCNEESVHYCNLSKEDTAIIINRYQHNAEDFCIRISEVQLLVLPSIRAPMIFEQSYKHETKKYIKNSTEYITGWLMTDLIPLPYHRCQTHSSGCIIFYAYSNGKPPVCCLCRMPSQIVLCCSKLSMQSWQKEQLDTPLGRPHQYDHGAAAKYPSHLT